jgi:hypothetical protein
MRMMLAFSFAGALLLLADLARADIVYNYDDQWLFDSESALYWQLLPIPSATFVPSYGAIAGHEMLATLLAHVGASYAPSLYSPALANLLSFFQSGLPAASETSVSASGIYHYPPSGPVGEFETVFLAYEMTDVAGLWLLSGTSTIGSYGPQRPCWEAILVDGKCPEYQNAFVVSSTAPVPLPAAVWLLMSGIGALGVFGRKLA